MTTKTQYPFLSYASTYWILHTASFRPNDQIWGKWDRLILGRSPQAKLPWTSEQLLGGNQEVVTWIARTDHVALLRWAEKRGIEFRGNSPYQSVRSVYQSMLVPAILADSVGVVEYLCHEGPCKGDRDLAMQYASQFGALKVTDLMLALDGDVNTVTPAGLTLLQTAAEAGHTDVVRRLLDAGAAVDKTGILPDEIAVNNCTTGSALQLAAERGHIEVAMSLIRAGATVNVDPGHDNMRTPLQAAAGGGHIQIVQALLAVGADIHADPATARGRTALQAAAEGGHLEVVDILLAAGADFNAPPSDHGRTALQAAANGGHNLVIDRLLAMGADVNAGPAPDGGRTALQAAAEKGHLETVQKLIAASANINAPRGYLNGYTAREAASINDHIKIVKLLDGHLEATPRFFIERKN